MQPGNALAIIRVRFHYRLRGWCCGVICSCNHPALCVVICALSCRSHPRRSRPPSRLSLPRLILWRSSSSPVHIFPAAFFTTGSGLKALKVAGHWPPVLLPEIRDKFSTCAQSAGFQNPAHPQFAAAAAGKVNNSIDAALYCRYGRDTGTPSLRWPASSMTRLRHPCCVLLARDGVQLRNRGSTAPQHHATAAMICRRSRRVCGWSMRR